MSTVCLIERTKKEHRLFEWTQRKQAQFVWLDRTGTRLVEAKTMSAERVCSVGRTHLAGTCLWNAAAADPLLAPGDIGIFRLKIRVHNKTGNKKKIGRDNLKQKKKRKKLEQEWLQESKWGQKKKEKEMSCMYIISTFQPWLGCELRTFVVSP